MSGKKQARTALVTGASEGIGFATAAMLLAAGYNVIITGRRETALKTAATSMGARALPLDMTNLPAVESAVAELEGEGVTVDVLVNNAGLIGNPGGVDGGLTSRLRDSFEANFFAPAHLASLLMPGMMSRGFGRVINVASAAGVFPPPAQVAYATSKAAVIALTRSLAVEGAAKGVTVNAVAPGAVETENYRSRKGADGIARRAASIPSGRLTSPDEVASAIAYLASDLAAQVNGQVVALDGGEGVAGPYVTFWQDQRR